MGLASITNNIITDTSIPSANVITGTLASGQVAYGSAANTIAGSNNLFWSGTALGVGTNTPSATLHVSGDTLVTGNLTMNRSGGGTFSVQGNQFLHDAVTTAGQLVFISSTGAAGKMIFPSASSGMNLFPGANNELNGSAHLRITSRLLNNANGVQVSIATNASAAATAGTFAATGTYGLDGLNNLTGGSLSGVRIAETFTANIATQNIAYSGFTFVSTINQSTAVGLTAVTRGVHINPTITAAVDFRAIEWSNNAATAPAVSWGLYGAGTAPNYLAGRLQIGSATATTPSEILQVTGNGIITGSLGFGTDQFRATILAGSGSNRGIVIQDNAGGTSGAHTLTISGVKTNGNKSDILLNANFSATATGQNYVKLQLTGTYTELAGGSICHGIYVNTTIGAVNNYRAIEWTNNNGWGLYGSGTGANYLNGSLLIGSAIDDGINKLQVTGSILATTNSTISGLSVGKGAGNVATNTALGAFALITNSTGAQNTAVGNEALRVTTTGLQNSAFGYRASRANTTGSTNSAFGIDTLRVNTTGNNNAAFGAQALDNNTAGNNTAIGTGALLDNTSGVGNTALGYRAGFAGSLISNITGSNNIFIGADSLGESTSDSNRTFIGNTSTTSTWLGGRLLLGSRTDDAANRLQVTGASALVGTTYVNTNASIAGYNHSLQVLANAAGGMIVSTTNSASAIGIVNSSSANKTWDISPFGNNLAINESGSGSRMYFLSGGNTTIGGITNSGNLLEVLGTFRTTGVNTLSNLGGVGSRMVVADANGVLSTQAIPGGTLSGSGVAGQVTYWSGASSLTGNNSFFWDAGNSRLGIGLNTPLSLVDVRGTVDTDYLQVARTTDASTRYVRLYSNGSIYARSEGSITISYAYQFVNNTISITSGSAGILQISNIFSPATGNASYTSFLISQGVDQSGGATGTTRGIYINPSLTNVADWRSIEWSNNTGWGIYGAGVAPNFMNGRLTVSSAIAQTGNNSFATLTGSRIGLFGSQTLNVPTTGPFNQGTVSAAGTSAQYITFNGNTTIGGDALVAGSVHINSVEFATTGTITMADSATLKPRTLAVMQLQMQKAGTIGGTITKGSTLYLFGVYPTTSTGGTVTFTEYAGLRIGNLTEWTGGPIPNNTVSLANRWGIYQEGDTDPNYFAGSVGIGVATNNASAKLQVDSTTQGFLPPRMTTAQRNAIATPAAGLIVYDTTDNRHYGYNGTTWNAFY